MKYQQPKTEEELSDAEIEASLYGQEVEKENAEPKLPR